jgi:hypothetical protein
MFNQKEAVYSVVMSVFNAKEETNDLPISQQIGAEDRKVIVAEVTKLFIEGKVALSSPQADIKKYVVGLVNNWLRKDTRLNDGAKYITKNPGSRSCVSDPVIKNLKNLLCDPSLTTEQRAYIQAEIDKRIAATKPTPAAVDMNLIPDHIKAMLTPTLGELDE